MKLDEIRSGALHSAQCTTSTYYSPSTVQSTTFTSTQPQKTSLDDESKEKVLTQHRTTYAEEKL